MLFLNIFYIVRYRRKVVKEHLDMIFPEKSPEEKHLISKKFFRHFSDMIVETIKLLSISETKMKERFKINNPEILNPYYTNNRSVLLMAGHYGNWEWAGIINKYISHQGFAVYKPIKNIPLDNILKKMRGRFGGIIISNKYIVGALYRKSKEKIPTLTYILSDQTPKLNSFKYRDTFLGINVPMFTGVEEMAKRLDFSVLYFKVEKIKRGYYTATLVPLADNPNDFSEFELTRLFFDSLENQIYERPEFYLWSHKRWKHRDIRN